MRHDAALKQKRAGRLQVGKSKFKRGTPDTSDADLCEGLVYTDQNRRAKITVSSQLGPRLRIYTRLCERRGPNPAKHVHPTRRLNRGAVAARARECEAALLTLLVGKQSRSVASFALRAAARACSDSFSIKKNIYQTDILTRLSTALVLASMLTGSVKCIVSEALLVMGSTVRQVDNGNKCNLFFTVGTKNPVSLGPNWLSYGFFFFFLFFCGI